jgi:hypothetical protein
VGEVLRDPRASFLVLTAHLAATIFFFHVMPSPGKEEFHGPFALSNYLVPALAFAVPLIVFLVGTAFWVGERTRRPILVFVLPVAILLICGFFLWDWTPSWLDPEDRSRPHADRPCGLPLAPADVAEGGSRR